MQTGKRLSSPGTFFQKRVFPVIWFAGVFLGLITIFFIDPKPGQSRTPFFFIMPGMAVFGYVLMRHLVFDLVDEVHDLGDSLLVKNRGVEASVPLRNINKVTVSQFSKPVRITLTLGVPCELGDKIVFEPLRKWAGFGSQGNAIADGLHRRSHCCKEREGS